MTRKEAIFQGLARYFTGKPCIRGHISERTINNGCCECHASTKNQDNRLRYHRDYRSKNMEKRNKWQQERRKNIKAQA